MLYPTEVPLSEIRRLITALRERGGADIVAKSAWLVQGYLQNVFFGDPDTPRAMMESSDNPEVQEFLSACNELGPCINDYCDTEECETGQTFSSSSGNLSSDLSPRWKNWSAQHTDVSKTDLIRKWREAATKTDFRPPVEGPYSNMDYMMYTKTNSGYNERRSDYCGYYTTYDVLQRLEESLESQNDNLGNDIAPKDGSVMFRMIPVCWVPYLDNNDSTNPVYGINWRAFKPAFLTGEYMRENQVQPHPLHHRTIVQYIDCTYNFFSVDRRRQFVLFQ